jgi:hypothetical protein
MKVKRKRLILVMKIWPFFASVGRGSTAVPFCSIQYVVYTWHFRNS